MFALYIENRWANGLWLATTPVNTRQLPSTVFTANPLALAVCSAAKRWSRDTLLPPIAIAAATTQLLLSRSPVGRLAESPAGRPCFAAGGPGSCHRYSGVDETGAIRPWCIVSSAPAAPRRHPVSALTAAGTAPASRRFLTGVLRSHVRQDHKAALGSSAYQIFHHRWLGALPYLLAACERGNVRFGLRIWLFAYRPSCCRGLREVR